jgi:hypothetical protein
MRLGTDRMPGCGCVEPSDEVVLRFHGAPRLGLEEDA